MAFKTINVIWHSKSGSLSIRCRAHNAAGVLMTGEDITMFCGNGGQCILGEWRDLDAYKRDLEKLKGRIKKSPLVNPPRKRIAK